VVNFMVYFVASGGNLLRVIVWQAVVNYGLLCVKKC